MAEIRRTFRGDFYGPAEYVLEGDCRVCGRDGERAGWADDADESNPVCEECAAEEVESEDGDGTA